MPGEILSQLPEDLRTNEALTGFDTAGDIAKAYLDTKGKASEFEGKVKEYEGKIGDLTSRLDSAIPKLSDNATPEEIAAFNKALGALDKPEDYKFEKPKDLPVGLDYSDNVVQWWAQTAHELGIPDKTAKGIFERYNKMAVANYNQQVKELAEQVEKENQAAQAALKEKWGTEYDKNYELAVRCIKQFGGEEFGKELIAVGLGNLPRTLEFMVNVSKAFKDDTLADLTMGQPKQELKPGQLQWSYPSMGA